MPADHNYQPEINQLGLVKGFIEEQYPDNVWIVPANVENEVAARMHDAGVGLAEVILQDGHATLVNYSYANTPVTNALELIWEAEERGEIQPGSHAAAYNSIRAGAFAAEWGSYIRS